MNYFFGDKKLVFTFAPAKAKIAQLVEHDLAKVRVAGSSPVFRSTIEIYPKGPNGGIGRRAGLKILLTVMLVPVRFRLRVQKKSIKFIFDALFCFVNRLSLHIFEF